jgi:hypothetical protein
MITWYKREDDPPADPPTIRPAQLPAPPSAVVTTADPIALIPALIAAAGARVRFQPVHVAGYIEELLE